MNAPRVAIDYDPLLSRGLCPECGRWMRDEPGMDGMDAVWRRCAVHGLFGWYPPDTDPDVIAAVFGVREPVA